MLRDELESYLADLLSVDDFNDYCPNGLQAKLNWDGFEINWNLSSVVALSPSQNHDAIIHHISLDPFFSPRGFPVTFFYLQRMCKFKTERD